MMSRRTWIAWVLAIAAGSVWSHHSYDFNYDTRIITITGKVALFAIENPHSRLVVESRNAQGTLESWTIETVPASRAAQMNHPLQNLKLKAGDVVTVLGWPAKDGSKRMGGHKLMLPDQREIMLRPALNLQRRD